MDTTTFIHHELHDVTLLAGGLDHWPSLFPGGRDQLSRYSSLAVITDETLYPLYAPTVKEALQRHGLSAHFLVIPAGEAHKTIFTATACWEGLLERGFDREGLLIAIGGGTVTDLGGFVASTYMRGVDSLNIPTTLMGMVDAAIGGKTGVNSPQGKTVIGTFHQPIGVLIDPTVLRTQEPRPLLSGMAELIKYAIIGNEELLAWLLQHDASTILNNPALLIPAIEQACRMKLHITGADEHDRTGERALLNFGHTFAHALETLSRYSTYLHGEAVAIGMSCAAHLSCESGYASKDLIETIDSLCARYHLPTTLPRLLPEAMATAMQRDKKASRQALTCILAKGIGHLEVVREIPAPKVIKALTHKWEYDAALSPCKTTAHG